MFFFSPLWMHANHSAKIKVNECAFVQHILLSSWSLLVYGAVLAEEGCVTRSIAAGRIRGFNIWQSYD